jgi:hypothetical protein
MGLSKNDVMPSGGDIIKKVKNSKTSMLFFWGGGVIRLTDKKVGN